MKTWKLTATALACAFLFAGGISAQMARVEEGNELERIADSLEEIAELLTAELESAKLQLVLRRIELSERRIQPLEEAVRDAEAAQESASLEVASMQSMLDRIENQLRDNISALDSSTESALRTEVTQVEFALRQAKRRVRNAEQRIVELENEVLTERDRVDLWQQILDEAIEFD